MWFVVLGGGCGCGDVEQWRGITETSMRIEIMLKWFWVVALSAVLACASAGCALGVFHDAISTRLDVTGVELTQRFVASKRFKFERDVAAAKGAQIERGWMELDGNGVDLSALSRVRIYVIEPGTEARVQILEGGGFLPGDTYANLQIKFTEDLRRMVSDQRVNLEWEIEPNLLYREWDEAAEISLRFGITLEVETE